MQHLRLALAGALALVFSAASALAADDSVTGKNASGATITFCSKDVGAGVMASCSIQIDTSGVKLTPAKDSSVDQLEGYVDGLEALITSSNTKLDTLNTTLTSDPADGAPDSSTSAKLGAKCATSAPAIETAADRVPLLSDCIGRLVIAPNALPASLVSGLTAAMTGTTSTAVTGIGAPAAGLRNYITTLVCGNSHATVGTFVEVQDGSGGTTFFTVPAAAVYGGTALTFPTPLKQPTTATALFVKDTTTGANVICSAAGFTAP